MACRQAELDCQRRARRGCQAGEDERPAGAAAVHAGLRRRARRGVQTRRPRDRDNGGDELRHRPQHPPESDAGALLRRRHRRAAGAAVRQRAGAAGLQARRRDLLDLPPARLRPGRPRHLPAETRRRAGDGPCRARRRRRPDPPRRLRHRLPAAAAAPRADGPARRGDARPHAAHGADVRRPGRAALPARRRGRRAAAGRARAARDRHRRDPARGRRQGRAARLRQRRRARRRRRPTCWPSTASARRSPTPASRSRSTPAWSPSCRPSTTCS